MHIIQSFFIAAAILALPGSAVAQCQLDSEGCAPNAKPPSFYQPAPSPAWNSLSRDYWSEQKTIDDARREALGAVLRERRRQGRTIDDGLTGEQRRWGWRRIP